MHNVSSNNTYWATGCSTHKVENLARKFYLEYNNSIGMYRINHDNGVPQQLMGYSPHRKALIQQVNKWVKQH